MIQAPGLRPSPRTNSSAMALLLVLACLQSSGIQAQTSTPAAPANVGAAAAPPAATAPVNGSTPPATLPSGPNGHPGKAASARPSSGVLGSNPAWHELSAAQQEALQPLAPLWPTLSEVRKRKWLALSRNFRALSDEEKEKIHSRMTDWVTLSNQERTQARLNYAQAARLAPEERRAQWEAYQALSDEERHTLAKKSPKHMIGATTAPAKPLMASPRIWQTNAGHTPSHGSIQILTGPHHVNMHTLLPEPELANTPPAPAGGAER